MVHESVVYSINDPIEQWFYRGTARQLDAFRRRVTTHLRFISLHPLYGRPEAFKQAMTEHNEQGENSRYVLTKTKHNGEEWPVLVEVVLGQFIHDLKEPGTALTVESRTPEGSVDGEAGAEDEHYETDQTGTLMLQHCITSREPCSWRNQRR